MKVIDWFLCGTSLVVAAFVVGTFLLAPPSAQSGICINQPQTPVGARVNSSCASATVDLKAMLDGWADCGGDPRCNEAYHLSAGCQVDNTGTRFQRTGYKTYGCLHES